MVNIIPYKAPNGETVLMSAQETQNAKEHKIIVAKLGEEQAATKAGILQTSQTGDMLEYDEVSETD